MLTHEELVDLFHFYFCPYEHEDDPEAVGDSDKCCYPAEESMVIMWEQPDHAVWLASTTRLYNLIRKKPELNIKCLRNLITLDALVGEEIMLEICKLYIRIKKGSE